MTWTSAVGRSSKWLLYKIVHGLALTRISPNALTFIGLLINVVAGFLFGYANAENQRRMFLYVSSVMVSYTRARAESLVQSCKAGFMERPERIVLVIIGALFNRMGPVLWVIAVLSTITVIHRIRYTC